MEAHPRTITHKVCKNDRIRRDASQGYLEQLRSKLKALGAKKVEWKGGWYWDLKPDFKRGDYIDL